VTHVGADLVGGVVVLLLVAVVVVRLRAGA
jgi:hypothetical protein